MRTMLWRCVEKGLRWINACNFLAGLGFDKFIVYKEADRLLELPSIGGFEIDI